MSSASSSRLVIPRSMVRQHAVQSSSLIVLMIVAWGALSGHLANLFSGRLGDIVFLASNAILVVAALSNEPLRTAYHVFRRRRATVQIATTALIALFGGTLALHFIDVDGAPILIVAVLMAAFAAFCWTTIRLANSYGQFIRHPSHLTWRLFNGGGSRSSRPRSISIAILASASGLAIPLLLTALYNKLQMEDAIGIHAEAMLRIMLLIGAVGCMVALLRMGVAYARPDAIRLTGTERSDLTLLLRSFADEHRWFGKLFGAYRVENLLDWEVGAHSNFVAIGDPKDIVPALGAFRTYATNETWQQVFADFAQHCDTIIAVAGQSTWLQWELEELVRLDKTENLLIVFPNVRLTTKQKLVAMVAEAVPEAQNALHGVNTQGLLCLAFRRHSPPMAIESSSPTKSAMRVALAMALGWRLASEPGRTSATN